MFLVTFCVIFVNFIEIRAEWCNRQQHTWFNKDVVSCDSSWEKCCDTGCCPRYNFDMTPVWVTVILVFVLLAVLFACCRKLCASAVDTRNVVPQQHHGSNARPPELIITLPIQQVGRNVTINVPHPITPPPSYEIAMSAPPAHLDNRIPSYADVIRGK